MSQRTGLLLSVSLLFLSLCSLSLSLPLSVSYLWCLMQSQITAALVFKSKCLSQAAVVRASSATSAPYTHSLTFSRTKTGLDLADVRT